jgi:serine/threonine-protein kinase
MVGAFGEVQVVDWGFAKVLAQGGVADERRAKQSRADMTRIATVRSTGEGSESVAGSVMGTPAYMPPEQALGHVDELDERSDVFSLGGILCEILTGAPVYVGAAKDLLVLAAQGRTEDACGRLAACGADPDLIATVKRCLGPARRDRPRDAGQLADAIAHYLAAAEERAQAAKLASIESRRVAAAAKTRTAEARVAAETARTKAEKERAKAERAQEQAALDRKQAADARRSRRLLTVLAAAVLLALLVGGGVLAFLRSSRQESAHEAAGRVNRALEEARRLKGESRWSEALIAAQPALSEGGERARAAVTEIEAAKAKADASAARRREQVDFLARLEEIRLARADDLDAVRTNAEYQAAFRDMGIHVERTQEAAEKIRAIPECEDVIVIVDEWAFVCRAYLGREPDELVALADLSEPDDWRRRLREAHRARDRNRLMSLAEKAFQERKPRRGLSMLGVALREAGDLEGAVQLLAECQRRHPKDLWVNVRLGSFLIEQRRWQDATRYLSAALALRPQSVVIRSRLAVAVARAGDIEGALAEANEALAQDKASPWPHLALAHIHAAKGDEPAALRELDEAGRLAPGDPSVYVRFGVTSDRANHKLRRTAYRRALAIDPNSAWAHCNLSNALRDAGDFEGAIREARAALAIQPQNTTFLSRLGLALDAAGRLEECIEVYRKALAIDPDDWGVRNNLGGVLRHAGDHEGALAELGRAAELNPASPFPHSNMGKVWRDAGNLDEAIRAYWRAIKLGGTDAATFGSLGFALLLSGDLQQAEVAAREALRLDSGTGARQNQLGVILGLRGDWEGALAAYRAAHALEPNDGIYWTNIAGALLHLQDPDAALQELNAGAVAVRPVDARIMMARALAMKGDRGAALRTLREAVKAEPAIPTRSSFFYRDQRARAYWLLGRTLLRDGQIPEARDAMTEGHRLGEGLPTWPLDAAQAIEHVRDLVFLLDRVDQVVGGKEKPREPLSFAALCTHLGHDETALRLFERGFREEVLEGYTVLAASAALRAGMRAQALHWLRKELEIRKEHLSSKSAKTRRTARQNLINLHIHPAFMAARQEAQLKSIPEPERGEWRAFWVELRLALGEVHPLP